MNSMKQLWVVLLASLTLLAVSSGTYAGTPLYQESLMDGRSSMASNDSEVDLLLSRDADPEVEDSWVIFSLSASGCILSGCTGSGCLLSACGASGCWGSACGGSGCIFSGCAGSGCAGSTCGVSGCGGSGCGGSGCIGSVCAGSYCVGSVCAGSGCAGSVCGGSVCGGSTCGVSICFGTGCSGSICAGSGCSDSLCDTTACGASACASGCCSTGSSLSVAAPSEMLVAAHTTADGVLALAAKRSGLYHLKYKDSDNKMHGVDVRLSDSHLTSLSLDAKELLTVSCTI